MENEKANGYVRSAAMEGMVSLVDAGQRTRDEVMRCFLQLFQKLERKPGAQWDTLANVCVDLWPQEAIEELRLTYQDGLVDPRSIDWQDVQHALALGKEGVVRWRRWRTPLIDDVAKATRWMQCFHRREENRETDEEEMDSEEEVLATLPDGYTIAPLRRATPKVGRNEPCPCGSGKKFKKCCGSAESGRFAAQPN